MANRSVAEEGLVDRQPGARFIIDQMGISQPSVPPAPPDAWADLPKVVRLAKRNNAVSEITDACILSKHPCPFPDIRDPLKRIFDAWGFRSLPVGHGLDARLRGPP